MHAMQLDEQKAMGRHGANIATLLLTKKYSNLTYKQAELMCFLE
jgi:hypothetical protein